MTPCKRASLNSHRLLLVQSFYTQFFLAFHVVFIVGFKFPPRWPPRPFSHAAVSMVIFSMYHASLLLSSLCLSGAPVLEYSSAHSCMFLLELHNVGAGICCAVLKHRKSMVATLRNKVVTCSAVIFTKHSIDFLVL